MRHLSSVPAQRHKLWCIYIIHRIENLAFRYEVTPRRREDVDQNVRSWPHTFGRVDQRRRDDCETVRVRFDVFVLAPLVCVAPPWRSEMVDKLPFESERT